MSREYREEVMFYMTMKFYDEFLRNKFIVLDEYYNIIRDITILFFKFTYELSSLKIILQRVI